MSETNAQPDPYHPDATRHHSVHLSESEIRMLAEGELPETLRTYAAECVLWFDGQLAAVLRAETRKGRGR